jgi:hypothetical protein
MHSQDLDPIRSKVELFRSDAEAPPPFAMASNSTYPSAAERVAIQRWATIRDACIQRRRATLTLPPSATPMQATFIQQDRSFAYQVEGSVSELVVALYQGKLTYGEFAEKRYEIGRDEAAAERQFRAAAQSADEQRQLQARQQFENSLATWATVIQAINARQPHTCTSFGAGAVVTTNCY